MSKEELQKRNCLDTAIRKTMRGFNITLNSDAAPSYKHVLFGSHIRHTSASSIKHQNDKKTIMKQTKGLNWDLKPDHRKTTIKMTTTGPTTDTEVMRQTSNTDWVGSRHLVRGPIDRRAIKGGNEVINHNWINNHANIFPQNRHVVTWLFVASDLFLKSTLKIFCVTVCLLKATIRAWLQK